MARHTAPAEEAQFESIHAVVDSLEVGDEFDVFANHYKVVEKVECDVRPYLTVRKESVSGFMATNYRLEQADPTNKEADNLISVKADRKDGQAEPFVFDASRVEA